MAILDRPARLDPLGILVLLGLPVILDPLAILGRPVQLDRPERPGLLAIPDLLADRLVILGRPA